MKNSKKFYNVLLKALLSIVFFDIVNIIFYYKYGMYIEIENVAKYYIIVIAMEIGIFIVGYLFKRIEKLKINNYLKGIIFSIFVTLFSILVLFVISLNACNIGTFILVLIIPMILLREIIICCMKTLVDKKLIKKINDKIKQNK